MKKKSGKKNQQVFAKRSFGQNFLIDPNYITKIISALNPQANETIIEIGPGRGALTERILESGARLIAVELDKDLIPVLKKEFSHYENFNLIQNDALKINYSEIIKLHSQLSKKLVANLPYNISTAILQHLTRYSNNFEYLILMLQKEVVERITAEAGNKQRGFLTVLIGAYFETQKLFDVPPNAFRPAPKVWSSVIRLMPKTIDKNLSGNEKLFRDLISIGFAQKRKTIYNNLKNAGEILYKKDLTEILLENEIDPKRRAETLTIDEWLNLTESFAR
ncbi:16S rRNA (adenine(1518)-N(6)/adenine(1519)-N(6))-dimethyltransferaseRsmA [soil metagenome]